MFSRWKHDNPMSRGEFYSRFPDDAACARYMAAERWPDGFKCPACAGAGWELRSKRNRCEHPTYRRGLAAWQFRSWIWVCGWWNGECQ